MFSCKEARFSSNELWSLHLEEQKRHFYFADAHTNQQGAAAAISLRSYAQTEQYSICQPGYGFNTIYEKVSFFF